MADKIFFTADLHLGHANIIKYCNRPFPSLHDMNKTLINNWNSVVGEKDVVYILGDLCLADIKSGIKMVRSLKGRKILIQGNHDAKLCKKGEYKKCFEYIKDLETIKVDDPLARGGVQTIVLCHYAMKVWNKRHFGSWQLYGHSHGSLPDDPFSKQMDVGVDPNKFFPLTYEEVRDRMAMKQSRSVDGHVSRDL